MSRFYLPTPEHALPPRPPPPVDDDDDESPPPGRPPLPSGPSRPAPPGVSSVGGKPSPSRSAALPPSAGQTRALPVRKAPSPSSSSSGNSSQASSNGSLDAGRFPRSNQAAVTSPSSGSSSSSRSVAAAFEARATTSSLKTSSNGIIEERGRDSRGADSSNRLSRSQTWSGKRPQLKNQMDKIPPERPTAMTPASSANKSVTLRPGTRPPAPTAPSKPNRISRSMSATTDEISNKSPLRRVASDMDERSRPAIARSVSSPCGPSSRTTSQSTVSSIAEAESESTGATAAPLRTAPARPAPARPAPPRPAPARPPPAGPPPAARPPPPSDTPEKAKPAVITSRPPPSSDTPQKAKPAVITSRPPPPSDTPEKAKPAAITSRPLAHIPTRKATRTRGAPSDGQGTGERPRASPAAGDGNPTPPLGQRMQQRATSVREAIKKVSPQTRRRSRTERSAEEADAGTQPQHQQQQAMAEDGDNMKKRVWSSIRRVKKRPEPATKPPEKSRSEPPDELGILNRMVVQCVSYLNTSRGLNEEGLFRVPGDMTEVGRLRTKFLNGEEVDLSNIMDPNTVAGLLKFHFRELRFSIIPRGDPTKNLLAAMKANDTREACQVMEGIPQSNLASLRILLELFVKVRDNSDVNKMNSANLGQTCGMAIFHDMGAANSAFVLRFLIDNKEAVLP